MRLRVIASSFFVLALGGEAAVAKVSVDLGKATEKEVVFDAVGKPAFLKIGGKGGGLSGVITRDDGKITGKAQFKLATLDTGVDLRNRHMKEMYLRTEKYPTATLTISKLPWGPSDDKSFGEKEGLFAGEMTLHGVTKPVTGTATVSMDGGVMKAHVEFQTSIPDYGVDIPSFKGITVAENVTVKVDITAPVKAGAVSE